MRNLNAYLFGFTLPFLLMWCVQARADDDHRCQGGHNCNDGADIIIGGTDVDVGGGSVSISGDKAFAVGQGSFDVDINQCLASTAWNFVVFGRQQLKENATCIADGLDARGNHEAAAEVRCSQVETIYSTFPDFEQCVAVVTMLAPVHLSSGSVAQGLNRGDHDEDDSHKEEVRELQQQLVVLIEEQRNAAKAANRYATQQRKEKQADREYAQQMIEEIRQIEEPPSEN